MTVPPTSFSPSGLLAVDEPFDPYHKWLGIPRHEQPPDHYRLLGISPFEGDAEVIQAAADRQMGHVRTYQTGPHAEASQRLLNELAAAAVCLLDREKKAAYDARLRARLAATRPPAGLWELGVVVLLRGAVRYVVLHVRCFWIDQTRLGGAYWRLGVDVYHAGRYRDRLARCYERIERISQSLAARKEAAGEPPPRAEQPRTWGGRLGALGGRIGAALGAALAARRRIALLQAMGRAAYDAHGLAAGPTPLTEPIRDALERLDALRAELAELAKVPPGQALSPRQLAWLGLALLALLALFYVALRWVL
jgi:hypothetical protein